MARIGIVADRVGWEEKRLIEVADTLGPISMDWVSDESLCLDGDATSVSGFDLLLIRSRSYTRGGLVATLAEAAGVRALNTSSAIGACENKLATRSALLRGKVKVPDFRLVLSRKDFTQAIEELGLPVVLKPLFGGMGRRVTLIRDRDTAQSVYDYVEDLGHAFEQACLVEPYLPGGSVRCLVAGRQLVAAARFQPGEGGGDWRSNAALGNSGHAVAREPDLCKIIDAVVAELGEGLFGIDLFDTPDGYAVNEVNHAPAFRGVARTTDFDVAVAVGLYLQETLS